MRLWMQYYKVVTRVETLNTLSLNPAVEATKKWSVHGLFTSSTYYREL